MTAPLRVLVVDDESLARQRLKRLLAGDARVQVVGEASDVPTALTQLAQLRPTVLLLDVSMPGEDGFALLEALPPEQRPFVVFVTAHADAAVRAFDARATDFLVKPVRPERLSAAIDRAAEAVAAKTPASSGFVDDLRAELARLLQQVGAAPAGGEAPLTRFAVTVGRRTRFVAVHEVDWFEADGNYVRLHVGAEQHLVRATMQRLESQLDGQRFVRIHRSTIVPLDRVRELVMVQPGEYEVVLTTGVTLPVMRAYRGRLPGG